MIQAKTILKYLPHVLNEVSIPELGKKESGKVRDFFVLPDKRIIVTTDRQSAFDVNLGHIPFKGAVLNQLAAFWFTKTKKIIPNHLIATPDPNVSVAKNCVGIPVEMIVRGYMSGVTKTSIWYSYQKGERVIYGLKFPEGLRKNDKLPTPVITPTTHGGGKGGHDDRLTREEILQSRIQLSDGSTLTKKLYQQMEEAALALFDFGSKHCLKQGLMLVDTKYEFGLVNGQLVIMDEMHTPDSSRFWKADTYEARHSKGEEPENFDKEFLRLWYKEKGYLGDGSPPKMSEQLIVDLAQRYIAVYEKITGEKFESFSYPIQERIKKNVLDYMGKKTIESAQTKKKSSGSRIKSGMTNNSAHTITYSQVGDNYATKDPIKVVAQKAARDTGKNLEKYGFTEVPESRGESAFVWEQGKELMASVIEGLGTKNLIADGMRETTGKTYYDAIAHDTVATIINDLISVGAAPLVIHAYWAVEDNSWLADEVRMRDLISGWKDACDFSGVTWGGGETPTLKQIVIKDTAEFAGCAIGRISSKKRLITDKKLKAGDRILFLKSSGVNANGISLTRAIAKRLPEGYATKLSDGTYYGEALLTKSNIYAKLIQELLDNDIQIHYLSNITGHGMRKVMRANQEFTYHIEKIFAPQEIFNFIQKHANLPDEEMYGTYNMGQDYAIFLPAEDVKAAQKIVRKHQFECLDAGYIEKGERQVIIEPKNIVFKGETLDLR